jgi:hypothetical protein
VATALLVAATPFTVLVRVLPDKLIALVVAGIIAERFTAEAAIPLTIVVKLLPAKLFTTVLIMGTTVATTPFTAVVKLLAAEVFTTEFTAVAVAETPFTTEVIVLVGLASVCVVIEGAAAVGVHDVPFHAITCPVVGAVLLNALPCNKLAFQYAAVLFIVAVVLAVFTAAAVLAVTVLILLLNVAQLEEDKSPRAETEAVGKLNVCVVPVEAILKSAPAVPVVNV